MKPSRGFNSGSNPDGSTHLFFHSFDYHYYAEMKETKSLFGKSKITNEKEIVLEVLDVDKVIWSKKIRKDWKEFDHCNVEIRI